MKEYPYLYETHMHTSEASACAVSTGEEMALAAKEYGYAGIFITNHNWYGNNCISDSLDWEEWIHSYCQGYENAKKCGDEIGLDVFFGYEATHRGTDFLIYGVDEQWLIAHPEIMDASIAEQYRIIKNAGGMIIHAHPFRRAHYIPEVRLFPEYVDGVEVINATHSSPNIQGVNHKEFDDEAIAYAKKYNFPMTAGSDVHSVNMLGGGIAFRRRIESVEDYINAVMTGEDYLLTNGGAWFEKNGEISISRPEYRDKRMKER